MQLTTPITCSAINLTFSGWYIPSAKIFVDSAKLTISLTVSHANTLLSL